MLKRTFQRLLNALLRFFGRIASFFVNNRDEYPTSESANRVRVERLLKGDFRLIDVSTLFLSLRSRSFGGQSVVELGHFIAHAEERDRLGVITDAAKNYFFYLRFWLEHQNTSVELDDLPPYFPSIAKFGFSRVADSQIKKDTGLKRKLAYKILDKLLQSLIKKADGQLTLQRAASNEEAAVLSCAIRHYTGKELFDAEQLFREFSDALVHNNLLKPAELGALSGAKAFIALFAIATMHRSKIKLSDGWSVDLKAGSYTSDGNVTVWMAAQFPAGYRISSQFFTTKINVSDACDAKLAKLSDVKKPVWEFAIELSEQKQKLVHLSS